ncbi:MAG: Txe/YoeB family addiction module toxin [Spirochaetia bacterium]|jgi:toxin YoeB|nr:Txe/YoeB family addiction module toxin [Spirochaetia bacterium]
MINFSNQAWKDYLYWQKEDKTNIEKINVLIKDVIRNPYKGLGKPEPLRGKYKGYWSRRITKEHRFVYNRRDLTAECS